MTARLEFFPVSTILDRPKGESRNDREFGERADQAPHARIGGTLDRLYNHWILGKDMETAKPRWCNARDVLGWID